MVYYSTARSPALQELDSSRAGSWIHVVAPNEEEIVRLSSEYDLEQDLLTDALDLYESPRVERSDDSTYVYTRYYHSDNGVINATEPLLIIYRPNFILTLLRTDSAVLDRLLNGAERVITTQKTKTLLQILDEVNNSYQRYLIKANRQLLAIRSQLKHTDIDKAVLVNFIELEDDLNEFLSALEPQAAMLRSLLRARYLRLYEEDRELVEDLGLGTNELIALIISRLKTIVNIRQAYDAIASSELNRTFRRLTSISIFLMIPTVVSGLFGMNINLPFANHTYAFGYVMAFVFAASVLTIFIFHRRRWL